MTSVKQLELSLAKAEYLLTHETETGIGGDKQNFWQSEMGFKSAEAIREAILTAFSLEMLQPLPKKGLLEKLLVSKQSIPIS